MPTNDEIRSTLASVDALIEETTEDMVGADEPEKVETLLRAWSIVRGEIRHTFGLD